MNGFHKMQKKNFWQIYFGKDPFSKAEFIKAWIGWWVIAIVLLGVLSICTSLNLRGIGIALGFGFCQIHARYLTFVGWNKFIGVLGVFPVTNIILYYLLYCYLLRRNNIKWQPDNSCHFII